MLLAVCDLGVKRCHIDIDHIDSAGSAFVAEWSLKLVNWLSGLSAVFTFSSSFSVSPPDQDSLISSPPSRWPPS